MRSEVTLRAECLMPEKLLERSLEQGARFDAVRLDGNHGLIVDCDAASAEILLNQCDRFHLRAEVLSRRGRGAFLEYAAKRRTLPVGLLLCGLLCWMFLGRIWMIDIAFSGNAARRGDAAALRKALSAEGIRPGMERHVDLESLGERLRADAGDYSYVGARLHGVRLLVEAVPEVPSPSLYDVDAARDLVSDRDGIVVSAEARSGELCVQPGDTVRRGQLLIRGEEKLSKEETRPIAALGRVTIRTWFTGEASLPLDEERVSLTGRSAVAARLITPWFSLPISEGDAFPDERVDVEYLPIGGLFVPLEIERTTRREIARSVVPRDEGQLRKALDALAFADAAMRLQTEGPVEYDLRNRWIDYEKKGDRLSARAVYEISTDAAVTREALAEDSRNE